MVGERLRGPQFIEQVTEILNSDRVFETPVLETHIVKIEFYNPM